MKIHLKGFITCKQGEKYSDCRDNYCWSDSFHKFAISDGVSKSFFPGIWSKLLTTNYTKYDHNEDFVQISQGEWLQEIVNIVNSPDAKWYTKTAFNKKLPGLATFVGLEFLLDKREWRAEALGDSFLFFIPENNKNDFNNVLKLSSKTEPYIFDNFPDYYKSIGAPYLHGNADKTVNNKLEDGTFILMTDALAEWFIRNEFIAIEKLFSLPDQNSFQILVDVEREKCDMTNDDCSILFVTISEFEITKIENLEHNVNIISELIKNQESNESFLNSKVQPIEIESSTPIEVSQTFTLDSQSDNFKKNISIQRNPPYLKGNKKRNYHNVARNVYNRQSNNVVTENISTSINKGNNAVQDSLAKEEEQAQKIEIAKRKENEERASTIQLDEINQGSYTIIDTKSSMEQIPIVQIQNTTVDQAILAEKPEILIQDEETTTDILNILNKF